MSDLVKEINDDQFEAEVLQAEGTVIVDFWAPWCGPCKAIAPVLEELAQTHAGKIKFVKVNTQTNQNAAAQYNVRSIPNLIAFKGGTVHDQMIGFKDPDDLVKFVEKML